ncbi:MAG: hypothetical protein COA65_08855 [Rhodospirillaceae bacterium]|nr:MAG: hypothetical protein COA65_08855 [Rhodospirillaceae bacterium]
MPEIALEIAGQNWGGWTEVSVSRSIERLAGSFELGVTDRWPGKQSLRAISAGLPCRITAAGETLITGFIDDVSPSYDATSHDINVRGRDSTGDLIDCSAIHNPGEWKGQSLQAICGALTQPFGIKVLVATDTGKPFASFRIQESETVFEAIERACRQRAVLPIADGLGNVKLITASGAPLNAGVLQGGPGGNLLAASGQTSHRDRYSKIIVKGQQAGADTLTADDIATPVAEISDSAIARYRPLVVLAEEPGDGGGFKLRAKWERSVRRARARTAQLTVRGWADDGGKLWQPGTRVRVSDPGIGIDAIMLITTATFTIDERSGTRTRLDVSPPDGFDLLAEPEDEAATGW